MLRSSFRYFLLPISRYFRDGDRETLKGSDLNITRAGFTGGTKLNPTYRSLGDHTETVQMEYDPNQTTYEELLDLFWANHDSTTCNKRQYMSAIFYHTENQKDLASKSLESRKKVTSKTVTTQILPIGPFYNAEDYHQKYFLQKFPFVLNELGIDPDDLISSSVCARLNGYLGGYGSVKQFDAEAPSLNLSPRLTKYIRELLKDGIEHKEC
ncbi:hypothetical protein CHUAL_007308 [Chamberlinius hualienensis]